MQTVIGRLVSDAKVTELKDGRKVVHFTIARNDRFKVRGSDEVKQVTQYFESSYWIGTGIAAYLKKGGLVEASGRIGVNGWLNKEGAAQASLTFHVQVIRLHGAKSKPIEANHTTEGNNDDLPF